VVAGWPYAERHVPVGRTVVTTYGVYDAAADSIGGMLEKR
jgi:hypothetical protein